MENEKQELAVTEDLKHILAVLKPGDVVDVLKMREELADNWNKKQIFRTETEMRVSVLNDAKFPTPGAKYWQSVREMSAHFDALMNLSFDMRRNEIERLKLERKMKQAELNQDNLDIMEIQVDLDQNLYNRACMEQVAHDRVREIKTWSKIKSELNDGSFDDRDVNTHQAESLHHLLKNKAAALTQHSTMGDIVNVLGPLQTIERLKKEKGLVSGNENKQIEN